MLNGRWGQCRAKISRSKVQAGLPWWRGGAAAGRCFHPRAVAALHGIGFKLGGGLLAAGEQRVFRGFGGGFMDDDAGGVIGGRRIEPPRFVDERAFDMAQFWNPGANEIAIRILIKTLFKR